MMLGRNKINPLKMKTTSHHVYITLAFTVIVICAEYGMVAFGRSLIYTKLPTSWKEGPMTTVGSMQSPLMCAAYGQQFNQQQTSISVNFNKDAALCGIVSDDQSKTVYDPSWAVYLIPVRVADVNIKAIAIPSQSSFNPQSNGEFVRSPNVALDGQALSSFDNGSCIHTDYSPEEWWMVDFGKEYIVKGIDVRARTDSGHEYRFANIQVLMYITLNHSPKLCATFPGPHLATDSNNPVKLVCDEPVTARFLKILRTGNGVALDFCEVYFF